TSCTRRRSVAPGSCRRLSSVVTIFTSSDCSSAIICSISVCPKSLTSFFLRLNMFFLPLLAQFLYDAKKRRADCRLTLVQQLGDPAIGEAGPKLQRNQLSVFVRQLLH